jgi:hypothetical protein
MIAGFPVRTHVFATREELEEYVETELNEQGHPPEQGVVDMQGGHWFALRSAPGGDGYAFSFVLVDADDGMVHVCNGEDTGCSSTQCSVGHDVGPEFPVIALIREQP